MMPVSMVGRAAELTELAGAWSHVAELATQRTVVLTGAAGLGKSLLVATAVDTFTPRPRVVLSGTARVHTPAPYDWLAAVLSRHTTTDLPGPPDALAWLSQDPQARDGSAGRERYAPDALLRLAVRVVRALIGTGPAVIIVDDLHALDPASLNLVGELAAADLPALLLVTSRPAADAVSPALAARTLARLRGGPGTIRQHLGPLGVAETMAVLDQVCRTPVTPRVGRAVWERTGGNPYTLTELLAVTRGLRGLTLPLAGGDPATEQPVNDQPVNDQPALELPTLDRPALTARETQVLSCLAAGMSNKQVARSLGISIRTVTVHVSNLLRKTGSASRTEAAVWAVRQRQAVADTG